MPRIKSTIQSGPVIRSTITSTGAVGPQGLPGPNQVTDSTASNLQGVLVADGNKVREALPGEVVDASALQSALSEAKDELANEVIPVVVVQAIPLPTTVKSGELYSIGENRQVPYLSLPVIEPGGQLIIGSGSVLYAIGS